MPETKRGSSCESDFLSGQPTLLDSASFLSVRRT